MEAKEKGSSPKDNLLLISIVLVTVLTLALLYIIKSNSAPLDPSNSTDPSLSITESATLPDIYINPLPHVTASEPSPTENISIVSTTTPDHYPTPFPKSIGINTPDGFEVVQWNDDFQKCDTNLKRKKVTIFGVRLRSPRSYYPYQFSFWRFSAIFTPNGFTATPSSTPTATSTSTPTVIPLPLPTSIIMPNPVAPIGELILFDNPVILFKDKYYHVTISFNWEQGNAMWIDDLYYPSAKNDYRCQ